MHRLKFFHCSESIPQAWAPGCVQSLLKTGIESNSQRTEHCRHIQVRSLRHTTFSWLRSIILKPSVNSNFQRAELYAAPHLSSPNWLACCQKHEAQTPPEWFSIAVQRLPRVTSLLLRQPKVEPRETSSSWESAKLWRDWLPGCRSPWEPRS